jgi:hypothetical protein
MRLEREAHHSSPADGAPRNVSLIADVTLMFHTTCDANPTRENRICQGASARTQKEVVEV